MARRHTAVPIAGLILPLILVLASPLQAADADYAIPNGHFFTQTAPQGLGYSVLDEASAPFWSEYQRLGGVQAVGYPISRRFLWNGFVCQAMQRVVFQWDPQSGEVRFVNVFDLLSDAGLDDQLQAVRSVPKPLDPSFDGGKDFGQIVQARLALLEDNPAIQVAYHAVIGDPIVMNGLPTSRVTDNGNHYALRTQRVVYQQWKEDVPWAVTGQVTVALGGSIAAEFGVFPDAVLQAEAVAGESRGAPLVSVPLPIVVPLKVNDSKGNDITTMEQWSKSVRRSHWRQGRSAYSLADFIMNRNGAAHLESRISSVLSQPIRLEQGTPEYAARFDRYQGPARLDIGIFGQTGSGERLFVGVEAKVDESFGSETVCERYQKAIKTLKSNPRSKAAARVKELLSRYLADTDEPCESRFAKVGYQLLTATAGTVAVQVDVSVFYVAVFKTHEYDMVRGRANQLDYENFMNLTDGECFMQGDKGCLAHELTLDGKRLICIYEYFDVER